jgi:hypothetical protein
LERNDIQGPDELAQADVLAPWAVTFRYEMDDEPSLQRAATVELVGAIISWASVVAEP